MTTKFAFGKKENGNYDVYTMPKFQKVAVDYTKEECVNYGWMNYNSVIFEQRRVTYTYLEPFRSGIPPYTICEQDCSDWYNYKWCTTYPVEKTPGKIKEWYDSCGYRPARDPEKRPPKELNTENWYFKTADKNHQEHGLYVKDTFIVWCDPKDKYQSLYSSKPNLCYWKNKFDAKNTNELIEKLKINMSFGHGSAILCLLALAGF